MSEHVVHEAEIKKIEASSKGESLDISNPVELIGDVEVPLSVSVGNLKLSVERLLGLKENEILELDADSRAPMSLVLGDKVVAKGKLVVVDNQFGIQITHLAGKG